MTSDRWAQIDRVLQSALAQPSSARERHVREVCADDGPLRDEVLSLLAHADSVEGFLEPAAPAAPAGALVGRTLGRYHLLDLVGAGGMGEVYRAHDQRLDRDVAVKVLPAAVAHDPERLERFEREARALAKLEHPNILAIHDIGSEGGVTFTVTELLHGETLRARLAHDRLPWRKAVDLSASIADGLAAAHAQGVLHRDIKPENLFLTADGRVKILDFGLAAEPDALSAGGTMRMAPTGRTPPGTVLGTVGYMAPEQITEGQTSPRSDIFALGCVLYEMLTGLRAFARPTVSETLAAILAAPMPALAIGNLDTPPDLSHIVHRCVEKQPDERFQSATDLAFALRSTTAASALAVASMSSPEQRDVVETAPPQVARNRSSTKRGASRVALISAVVVVIVGAMATTMQYRSRVTASRLDGRKFVVAVFRNQTGDAALDALGFLISENITNGLSRLSGIQVALNPTVAVGAMTSSGAAATSESLGQRTGAGLLIDGTYYLDADNLRIEAGVVDVATGRTVMTFDPIAGARANPGTVVQEVTSRAMGAVADGVASNAELSTALALVRAPRYEALQERLLGSRHLYIDNDEARRHFLRALEIDPGYYAARMGMVLTAADLAEAHRWLDKILEDYPRLTPWQQLQYLVRRNGRLGRRADQVMAARQLAALDPMSPIFLSDLAIAEERAHHLRRAIAAAERVRPVARSEEFSGAAGNWLEILGRAHHELGEDQTVLKIVQEGQQRYPQTGLFLSYELAALIGLGRVTEIDAVIARASVTTLRSGGLADILGAAARELRVHGYRDQSIAVAERGIEFSREQLHPGKPTTVQKNRMAAYLTLAERWQDAFTGYSALVREEPDNLTHRGQLGVAAARLGRHAEARRIADALARVDRPFLIGDHYYQQARVLAALGAREDAMRALTRAYGEGRAWLALEIHQDPAFEPIADYPPFRQFLKSKD